MDIRRSTISIRVNKHIEEREKIKVDDDMMETKDIKNDQDIQVLDTVF